MTYRAKIIEIANNSLRGDDSYIENQSDLVITIASEIEELRSNLDNLFDVIRGDAFIAEFERLHSSLEAAGADFSSAFPRARNFRLFLLLANLVDEPQLDEVVPEGLFGMALHEEQIFENAYNPEGAELRVFGYQHLTKPEDSVILLNLKTPVSSEIISQSNLTKLLAAISCIIVGSGADELMPTTYVISSSTDHAKRSEHLKYQLLLHGMILTWPFRSPTFGALSGISETLSFSESYIQFKEPFEILSEVNSRQNVIDAYLSSYHVLENYMIRAQIAKVEGNSSHGAMFGIRHFKSLGTAVGNKESEHLEKLIRDCWPIVIGRESVQDFAATKIIALANDPDYIDSEFQDILRRLDVRPQTIDLTNQPHQFRHCLPKLLYAIRCAVVHNKETEFHISNRELRSATLRITLTKLCIPFMQRVGFGLPSVTNDNPIRYSRQHIALY